MKAHRTPPVGIQTKSFLLWGYIWLWIHFIMANGEAHLKVAFISLLIFSRCNMFIPVNIIYINNSAWLQSTPSCWDSPLSLSRYSIFQCVNKQLIMYKKCTCLQWYYAIFPSKGKESKASFGCLSLKSRNCIGEGDSLNLKLNSTLNGYQQAR